jgi:hypothetical protein
MELRDAVIHCLKALFCAAGSWVATIAAWMQDAWPVLQFCLGIVSMVAAFASIRASVATCNALKRQKHHTQRK